MAPANEYARHWSNARFRRWSYRHPRLLAGFTALVGGSFCALVAAALLASIAIQTFPQILPGCMIPVPVCMALAMLLFGPWLRSRRPATRWRASLIGVACVLLTIVIVAGAATIGARTQRALASGLPFGTPAYFDVILEGTAPRHVVGLFVRGMLLALLAGSMPPLFLPEIVGAVAGYMLWRLVGIPDAVADAPHGRCLT